MEELMATRDVCKVLRIHPNTVKKWSDNGKLPVAARIGNRNDRRFRQRDVQKILDGNIKV